MNLFSRKPKTQVSPWGTAKIEGTIATVSLGRFRGVCVDLWWELGAEPAKDKVDAVVSNMTTRWDAALAFLGVDNFPPELPVIIPESVHFPTDKDQWEMTFVYPKWEDGYWTVVFCDSEPIEHFEGD